MIRLDLMFYLIEIVRHAMELIRYLTPQQEAACRPLLHRAKVSFYLTVVNIIVVHV